MLAALGPHGDRPTLWMKTHQGHGGLARRLLDVLSSWPWAGRIGGGVACGEDGFGLGVTVGLPGKHGKVLDGLVEADADVSIGFTVGAFDLVFG